MEIHTPLIHSRPPHRKVIHQNGGHHHVRDRTRYQIEQDKRLPGLHKVEQSGHPRCSDARDDESREADEEDEDRDGGEVVCFLHEFGDPVGEEELDCV